MSSCRVLFLLLSNIVLACTASSLPQTRGQICYDWIGYQLGCFANEDPFWSLSRPISVLPDVPDKIGTRFWLYTRANKDNADELTPGKDQHLDLTEWDSARDTKIIIHGFTHSAFEPWVLNMKNALLDKEDFNVIAVDWRPGAGLPYTQATANTRVVGAQAAVLLQWLSQTKNLDVAKVHIIGHSLGAHTAGYTGERLTSPQLGRITGLDPIQPYFQGTAPVVRLDQTDASFVDVIHTDTSSLLFLGLGTSDVSGHVDFWPNGGDEQPNCPSGLFDKLFTGLSSLVSTLDVTSTIEDKFACNHMRSIHLFTETITNVTCPMVAFPCASWKDFKNGMCYNCAPDGTRCSMMGYDADASNARGSLYMTTGGAETNGRYCEHGFTVKVTTSVTASSRTGQVFIKIRGTEGETQELQATRPKTSLNPGSSTENRVSTANEIGDITEITLRWVDNAWFFTGAWYAQKIELTEQLPQLKTTKFCAHNTPVAHKGSVTLKLGIQDC